MALIIILLGLLLGGICCLEGMALSPMSDDYVSQVQQIGTWEQTPSYAPTPGFFDRERTLSVFSFSSNHVPEGRSSPLRQRPSNQLDFLEVDERGGRQANDEQSPSYIRYLIEWKVTLNNRVVKKDTEQDLVLKPGSYWEQITQNAEKALQRKVKRNQRIISDDTEIIVSVNDRSQDDLTKTFDGTDVDWTIIENQLLMWSNLLRVGKRLKLRISINYIEDTDLRPLTGSTDKRGKSSVTRRMLSERDTRMDAERASGAHMVWRDVYRIMRYPGRPCRNNGQYCWQDPVGKKHYKLKTHHLTSLIKFVERGGTLENHDDIPHDLRQEMYAEEEQRHKKQKKECPQSVVGSTCPPININLNPAQPTHPFLTSSDVATSTVCPDPIDISGPLDIAVEEYISWQESRVSRTAFKAEIAKAGNVALENCLDLRQIDKDQDFEFFVKEGVKVGAARRFVSEIRCWLSERQRRNDSEESLDSFSLSA
ncbi:uncharacterized protein KD926_002149 [Aspergillus affinis]|uniref:uncharacterized protein n=1 Tax=Aspergillus affinis TaxID=1070780 RepID=UPI0022FE90F2|nr:uncharacterized protein KD926_002149 [Aspergillus affinis]KAI9036240.1 hypothetical protein KD926_002149 [Aspergillus affinis]